MDQDASAPFIRQVSAGQTIFAEGETGKEFYIIVDGAVSILSGAAEIARLGPGEFFGEMAVLDHGPRTASAVAAGDSVLMAVDAARFIFLMTQQPGFALLVMETLSRRQRGAGRPPVPGPGVAARSPSVRVQQVGPGIWQLRAYSRSCNAYLVRGSDTLLLFDTGLAAHFADLEAALGELGVTATDIDRIVLTHEHFDHWAAAHLFPSARDVAAIGLAANKINLADDFSTMRRAFDEPAHPLQVTTELAEGAVIETGRHRFEVFHTPGHSSGGTSFHEAETGAMVVGDTVMKGGPISGIYGSGSIADMMWSLGRIEARGPKLLLAGHGPVSDTPGEDIGLTRGRCEALLRDSEAFFDALGTNETVKAIVNSVRDLNRSFPG